MRTHRKRIPMNQQYKRLDKIANVDGEHGAEENGAGGNVIDLNNPVLQPPNDTYAKKKSTWKRKLIGWSILLLLICAGVGALYLLLRVKRVDVTVNANSRRHTPSLKPQSEVTQSDSSLTAEAIDIARQEVAANSQPGSSASPVPSPSPVPTQPHKVEFTGDSPV